LKFLVLDEVHAYRGVQATEIGFLVRRLKDRLAVKDLTCVATSATLGKKDDAESEAKVRRFVTDLFDGDFDKPNPIYGSPATPELLQPSFCPAPLKYIEAAEALRNAGETAAIARLSPTRNAESLAALLRRDENLSNCEAKFYPTR
jgi:ATP-dependent helicase YprA (DUF1998 family)